MAEGDAELLEGLRRHDRRALMRLSGLVSNALARQRAYDFRDEWPDLIQEVMLSVILALQQGKIREPGAFGGYVRVVTRNKLNDRLRVYQRRKDESARGSDEEMSEVPQGEMGSPSPEARHDLARMLEQLPDRQRQAVTDVYVHGMKYAEAAQSGNVPLGSFKRYLREGMAELRRRLEGDPNSYPSASTSTEGETGGAP